MIKQWFQFYGMQCITNETTKKQTNMTKCTYQYRKQVCQVGSMKESTGTICEHKLLVKGAEQATLKIPQSRPIY